jgi:hypothetical protein
MMDPAFSPIRTREPPSAITNKPAKPHPARGNHLRPRRDHLLKVFLGREF